MAIGLLLYPGLALALLLGLALRRLIGEAPIGFLGLRSAVGSADGILALGSIALASLGLAFAPLPYSPISAQLTAGRLMVVCCAVEIAFLAPALAGLLAQSPLVQRVVSRDLQIGVGGRAVVWLAIGALATQPGGDTSALAGHVIVLLGGLAALPAATGSGPFAPERSLSPAGAEAGLDEPATGLLRLARAVRAGVLAALLIAVSVAPIALRPPIALLIMAALALVCGLALRALADLPQLTLPAALRWCWGRALPLALAGLAVLALA
jgi:hypothetical protein